MPFEPNVMCRFTVRDTTGVTATCGIGTNLYLAKIALDITAKHSDDYIGVLDEESYQTILWDHKPLKDLRMRRFFINCSVSMRNC